MKSLLVLLYVPLILFYLFILSKSINIFQVLESFIVSEYIPDESRDVTLSFIVGYCNEWYHWPLSSLYLQDSHLLHKTKYFYIFEACDSIDDQYELTSHKLLYDQDLFQGILNTPNSFIDVDCLTKLRNFTRTDDHIAIVTWCSLKRAIDSQLDLFLTYSKSYRESDNIEEIIWFIENKDLLHLFITVSSLLSYRDDLSPPLNLLEANETAMMREELKLETWLTQYQNYSHSHDSRHCRLWWPLNHTDFPIYSARLEQRFLLQSFYQVEETVMFHCDVPPNYTLDEIQKVDDSLSYRFQLRYVDYPLEDCMNCGLYYHENEILPDAEQQYLGFPIAVSVPLTFKPPENSTKSMKSLFPRRKKTEFTFLLKKIEVLIAEDQSMSEQITEIELGTFLIYQNIVYLDEINNPSTSSIDLHKASVLSRIGSRDDFGLVFSSLYPNGFSFIEVGVYQGGYANCLVGSANSMSIYIGIDTWKPWSIEEYFDITNVQELEFHEENYYETIQTLSKSSHSPHLHSSKIEKLLIREDASKAAHLFPNHSIDVVYIDAMHHYTAVVKDILTWYPKVKVGGIIAGHDFMFTIYSLTVFTVRPAVEKFARDNNLIIFTGSEHVPSWIIMKTHEI